MGIALWCEDEAGPYGTVPYAGESWQAEGQPVTYPHEYSREGTAKMLTLFRPVTKHATMSQGDHDWHSVSRALTRPQTGEVRVKGVTNTRNETLHGWLKEELSAILAALPEPNPAADLPTQRLAWESWHEGLTVKATLSADLPPLRLLLVMDNLASHHTPD